MISMKNKGLLNIFLINTIPFVLYILTYRFVQINILNFYFVALILLFVLNYKKVENKWHFVFVQSYLALLTFITGFLTTHIHYNYISNDGMTLAVGGGITYLVVFIVVIETIIALIAK